MERFEYDTSLDGLSNLGHGADVEVRGELRRLDWDDDVEVVDGGPRARPGSDLEALLEYLKTL